MLKLQAVDLSKSYRGRKVVDDVELEIGQGEVVGLLGPNGAGKTTTFYILVGLARPDAGRAGNPSTDGRTAERSPGGVAGADGFGNGAVQPGVHAVGRRAAAAGNREVAGAAAGICSSGRAVFRD